MCQSWETYEKVAQHLLEVFADEFDLGSVQGKQIVEGSSGTKWEIDAKGILKDGDGFVVIECRRYTTSRLSQEQIASLAYRIKDTKSEGGILVSPLGFQKGAQIIAEVENIANVILHQNSTTTDYILAFLNKIMVGKAEQFNISDNFSAIVSRKCPKCGTTFDETEVQPICPTCSCDCNKAASDKCQNK